MLLGVAQTSEFADAPTHRYRQPSFWIKWFSRRVATPDAPTHRYRQPSFWIKWFSCRVATKIAPVKGIDAGLSPTTGPRLHTLPIPHAHKHFIYEALWRKLRTGHRLRHWLPHEQRCPIDGAYHTHEHVLLTCANLERVWQHLAPCMLPFKHDNTPIRMFHQMLTVYLADSLSHVPSLVALWAIMANWHTVCTVKKAPALDA